MRTIRTDIRPFIPRLGSLLIAALLLALTAVPTAAQDVPTDGLLLRLQDDALETSSELAALEAELDRPTPYTAAAIHPHNGRWSVTISQGTLDEDATPSRFLNDEAAEFFFYDRVLEENERNALHGYLAAHYNASDSEGSGGLNQGIHVQGSWSIEVRDPDGSLQARQDFENALSASGDQALALLLASDTTAGNMDVTVAGDPAVCLNDGDPWTCFIQETHVSVSDSLHQFSTLTKDVPTSGDNEDALVLDGSLTARQDGSITAVGTRLNYCAPSTAPVDCGESLNTPFTNTTLQNAVSVEEGQQVQVEVVISFN